MTFRRLHTCISLCQRVWADASWDIHCGWRTCCTVRTWMALLQSVLADVFGDLQIRWRTCCTVRTWKVSLQSGFSCASSNERRLQMICHIGHNCAYFPFYGLVWSWPRTFSGQTHNNNWCKFLQNQLLDHHFPFSIIDINNNWNNNDINYHWAHDLRSPWLNESPR